MSTSAFFTAVVAAFGAVVLPSAEAWAQSGQVGTVAPPEVRRPYRGLFGGSADASNPAPPSLVLTGSAYVAYDDNIFARNERGQVGRDPSRARSGFFTGGDANLAFARSGDDGSFNASGGVQARRYTDVEHEFVTAYNSLVSFTRKVGGRSTLGGSYTLLYTPNYRLNMFRDDDGGIDTGTGRVDLDEDLFGSKAFRQAGSASLSRKVGRRSALAFQYSARYVDFIDGDRSDFFNQGGSGHYTNRITSSATVVLGYGYRKADSLSSDSQPAAVHDIDAGVNYGRALSFSRRTTVNFSTGSSVIAANRATAAGAGTRTRLRFIGNVSLKHEMGRTWSAGLGYHRGLRFQDGIAEPFDTNSAVANLTGLLSRRLEFDASTQWIQAAFAEGGRAYEAATGSAQLRYGLTRHLAVYARYTFSHYELDRALAGDSGFVGVFDRNGVRFGLAANVPLRR